MVDQTLNLFLDDATLDRLTDRLTQTLRSDIVCCNIFN